MLKIRNALFISAAGLSCATLLVACGGSSSSSSDDPTATTLTGIFNDSPVDGLAYSCAPSGLSGTTQNGGAFNYVAGDSCDFSFGAVELGSAVGAPTITPVELVANGVPSDKTVVNIVQLLTTADDDNDLSNGITITAAVATAAENWTDVNIQSGTFDTDNAVAQAVSDMGASALVDEAAALAHIKATAACVYSGLFKGTWHENTGTHYGDWGVVLFPNLTAIGISDDPTGAVATWQGKFDNATNTVTLNGNAGGTVIGTTSGTGSVSGTIFSGTEEYGSFSGSRFAGAPTATYRYTGFFTGDADGVFSIDITGTSSVSGKGYRFFDKSTFMLSGSVDSTGALTLSGSNGVTALANLDLATGAITNATWSDETYSGTFAGSGCKLN